MPALVRLDHSFVPSIRGVRGKTMDATRLQSNIETTSFHNHSEWETRVGHYSDCLSKDA